jgi:hypothetical protein
MPKWRGRADRAARPPVHMPMAVPVLGAAACVALRADSARASKFPRRPAQFLGGSWNPPRTAAFPVGIAVFTANRNRYFGERQRMDGIIYLVGLVVVILAVLSFFGLR